MIALAWSLQDVVGVLDAIGKLWDKVAAVLVLYIAWRSRQAHIELKANTDATQETKLAVQASKIATEDTQRAVTNAAAITAGTSRAMQGVTAAVEGVASKVSNLRDEGVVQRLASAVAPAVAEHLAPLVAQAVSDSGQRAAIQPSTGMEGSGSSRDREWDGEERRKGSGT